MPSTRPLLAAFFIATFLQFPLSASASDSSPRPFTEAERFAAELVLRFLDRGPEALVEALDPASPFATLPAAEALGEIAVRTGPHEGADWTMQTVVPSLADSAIPFSVVYPSGIDDTIILEVARNDDRWALHNVTTLAEPSRWSMAAPPVQAVAAAVSDERAGVLEALLAPAAFFLLSIIAAASRRRFTVVSAALLAGAMLVMIVGIVWLHRETTVEASPAAPSASEAYPREMRLADALPLRRAVTGAEEVSYERLVELIPESGSASRASRLWVGQVALRDSKPEAVRTILADFEPPSDLPLAEILRARIAALEGSETEAVLAWERAINLGPGRDALWMEAAETFALSGFDDRATQYLDHCARIRSRSGQVFYARASRLAERDEIDAAEKEFARAWQMMPIERRTLFSDLAGVRLARRPLVSGLLALDRAAEPLVTRSEPAGVALPRIGTMIARSSGQFLHIEIGDSSLAIPGGAEIAPDATEVVGATQWVKQERERALAKLPQLLAAARKSASLSHPALRHRLELAASALAAGSRWEELWQLTESLSPRSASVPSSLLFLKVIAARQTGRTDDARSVVLQMASSGAVQKRSETGSIVALAEMLVSFDRYGEAMRLFEEAARRKDLAFLDDRIRQVSMDQRLAGSYRVYRSDHFEIRYPGDVSEITARHVASILESELVRLRRWIPVRDLRTTTVHLLWWDEFRRTYTGNDHILAFYDGKLRLPFAGVPRFTPEITAVISHELAHAMIAQLTNDRAPHWIQEGLARHIEPVRYRSNPFSRVEPGRLFSLAIADGILGGLADYEMTALAYNLSASAFVFIEQEYGVRSIHRMLEAFARGVDTDEAIESVFGIDAETFEAKMRTWGRDEAPAVWVSELDALAVSEENRR